MNAPPTRVMISVCLATYNGGAYAAEQLHSVLAQLGEDDEVVVADDASNDDTLDVVRGLGDRRIRLLASGGNLGVIRNFERALNAARGEIVFLCDQDDVWLPGKVSRCVSALRTCLLVVTDCRVVDGELNVTHESFFRLRNSGPGIIHNLWRNSYLGCCMAFRRELLQMALPFPARLPMHDMWLGMLAETQGRTYFLPEALLLYRRHGGNASDTAEKSTSSLGRMIAYRARLATALFWRSLETWRRVNRAQT